MFTTTTPVWCNTKPNMQKMSYYHGYEMLYKICIVTALYCIIFCHVKLIIEFSWGFYSTIDKIILYVYPNIIYYFSV